MIADSNLYYEQVVILGALHILSSDNAIPRELCTRESIYTLSKAKPEKRSLSEAHEYSWQTLQGPMIST